MEQVGADVTRIKTYRDVLEAFRYHPDAKSTGPDGRVSGRQTVGLLRRRTVTSLAVLTTHVGKESNKLEKVEAGVEHDPDEIWTECVDAKRDLWRTVVRPVLRMMTLVKLEGLGLHRRSLFAVRAGERLPHPRNRQVLIEAAGTFARERLSKSGIEPPYDDLSACAVLVE